LRISNLKHLVDLLDGDLVLAFDGSLLEELLWRLDL